MNIHDIITTLWYITEVWWVLCAIGVAFLVHVRETSAAKIRSSCRLRQLTSGMQQAIRVEQRELSRLPGNYISKWTSIPSLIQLVKGTQPKYIHSLFLKYGPVVRLGPNQVCFSDVIAFQQIYNIQETFVKSTIYETVAESPAPSAFNTIETDMHRAQRELMVPGLCEAAVGRLYTSISSKVLLAVRRMEEETRQNGFTDIYKWWTLMTADVMGEITFGQSFRLLEEGKVRHQLSSKHLFRVFR